MAFPKNPKKDGGQQVRQYFNISVEDQVAWTALVNIIGPIIDPLIPQWSYGNRLHRSIWVETDERGFRSRKIGRYRHSSGRIYLPFGQSWPVFRRHVYLTTVAMTAKQEDKVDGRLSSEDVEELTLEESLDQEYRCPFISKEYWKDRRPDSEDQSIYWCSIDLEKFYPSLSLPVIVSNTIECLPPSWRQEAAKLIHSMVRFRLNLAGWAVDDLRKIGIRAGQKEFKHVPTGLYVAGFLSNVAMLNVDREVHRLIKERNIAHFRFVDDHIILAYRFGDLIDWIKEYTDLIQKSENGGKINNDKTEPEELSKFLRANSRSIKFSAELRKKAEQACKLNPKFPSPLMTKTLTLVSAIARTDFNLLEESELTALTNQLEHLLLVELPETEIPAKTRLSFAATRIMRLAQNRLSNDSALTELKIKCRSLEIDLKRERGDSDKSALIREDLIISSKRLKQRARELRSEAMRAFELLRKVLQDRPDRVRLWTQAIQMCRLTGVRGLTEIISDIDIVGENNKLAADYLMANTLSLVGAEVTKAAKIAVDPDAADWRREAAISFLKDVCSITYKRPGREESIWFLQISWRQLCFSIFCADLIFKHSSLRPMRQISFQVDIIREGALCLKDSELGLTPEGWAWWAASGTLGSLSDRAEPWIVEIGKSLNDQESVDRYWRYFPFDVPGDVILKMLASKRQSRPRMEGWWHGALRSKGEILLKSQIIKSPKEFSRVRANIAKSSDGQWISLLEWADETERIFRTGKADPRTGEWTALEVSRQIAVSIGGTEEFSIEYVSSLLRRRRSPVSLHPANFRVPRSWINQISLDWRDWHHTMRQGGAGLHVELVPEKLRIRDSRYSPLLNQEDWLFGAVNPVRGLGLLLYGLLKRDFNLPAIWNGPGHSDVLRYLPRFLLKDITCSSWTLGVLNGCLQARALENVFIQSRGILTDYIDNDSVHDPIILLSAEQFCKAMLKCQSVLKAYQLSTVGHRARQLTPINIKQLSCPEWSQVFKHLNSEEQES